MGLILSALLVVGAASQYVYELPKYYKVTITNAQAATGLAWFTSRGAWDGDPATQVKHCCITQTQDGTGDWTRYAECKGEETGTVPADSLPEGAVVTDVIN
jgi:hypothetical protein